MKTFEPKFQKQREQVAKIIKYNEEEQTFYVLKEDLQYLDPIIEELGVKGFYAPATALNIVAGKPMLFKYNKNHPDGIFAVANIDEVSFGFSQTIAEVNGWDDLLEEIEYMRADAIAVKKANKVGA